MGGLGTDIEGFLIADGFTVHHQAPGEIVAERATVDGTARRRIWFVDPGHGVPLDEVKLVASFAAMKKPNQAGEQAYFVAPTLVGLSSAFRKAAADASVGIRVPVQFFDTPYKADGDAAFGTGRGNDARSVFAEFVREQRHVHSTRVDQPYVALSTLGGTSGGFSAGGDLFKHLVAELSGTAEHATVTIVIGNAGAGKSYLFSALFDALNQHFATEKRALRRAARPILFLPGHIRNEQVRTIQGLIEAVAATDAAAATRPDLMCWLNVQGLSIWMFDGLDEFFAGEADFVAALEQCLAPGSQSRVLICARNSLLTTSTALRQFVDRQVGNGGVKLYELARWERPSQRALAWLRLERRAPGLTEVDTPSVSKFIAQLERSAALAELATLPYYCDLLLGLAGRIDGATSSASSDTEPTNEFELLAAAVDGLIDREADKLAAGEVGFDWDVFAGGDAFVDTTELVASLGVATFSPVEQRARINEVLRSVGRDRLVELIEGMAHRMRMLEPYPNEGQGLAVDELEQMAAVYLDVGLMPGLEPRVVLAIVQLAFFGPGAAKGHVRFAHEIVADFLAARHAVAIIRAQPESATALGQALGVRRDLDRSIVLRYLAADIARSPDLVEIVKSHVTQGRVRAGHAENAELLVKALDGAGA